MALKIVNKIKEFAKQNADAMDRSLNKMAIDIERLSKEQVPFGETGGLKASGKHQKIGYLNYRVSYNKRYARYQEFGGDGTRKVRRYSLPGKKKFYLRDPGRQITMRIINYFMEQARSIRV